MSQEREQEYLDAAAAYHLNSDWFEQGSLAKAKAFVTACTKLIGILPKLTEHQNERVEFDMRILSGEVDRAMRWASNNADADTGGSGANSASGAIHYDVSRFFEE